MNSYKYMYENILLYFYDNIDLNTLDYITKTPNLDKKVFEINIVEDLIPVLLSQIHTGNKIKNFYQKLQYLSQLGFNINSLFTSSEDIKLNNKEMLLLFNGLDIEAYIENNYLPSLHNKKRENFIHYMIKNNDLLSDFDYYKTFKKYFEQVYKNKNFSDIESHMSKLLNIIWGYNLKNDVFHLKPLLHSVFKENNLCNTKLFFNDLNFNSRYKDMDYFELIISLYQNNELLLDKNVINFYSNIPKKITDNIFNVKYNNIKYNNINMNFNGLYFLNYLTILNKINETALYEYLNPDFQKYKKFCFTIFNLINIVISPNSERENADILYKKDYLDFFDKILNNENILNLLKQYLMENKYSMLHPIYEKNVLKLDLQKFESKNKKNNKL